MKMPKLKFLTIDGNCQHVQNKQGALLHILNLHDVLAWCVCDDELIKERVNLLRDSIPFKPSDMVLEYYKYLHDEEETPDIHKYILTDEDDDGE